MSKMLIADDNRQITSILEQYAVREGFEVQVAADGQTTRERADATV